MTEYQGILFRGNRFSKLGEISDELHRIADSAPEDAEEFKYAYIISHMVSDPDLTYGETESIVGSNIRFLAGMSDIEGFHKIMSTFYPPVVVTDGS